MKDEDFKFRVIEELAGLKVSMKHLLKNSPMKTEVRTNRRLIYILITAYVGLVGGVISIAIGVV